METPFHAAFTSDHALKESIGQTALHWAGLPEDVAGAVVYLVSDLARFVTGEIIELNGGLWFG